MSETQNYKTVQEMRRREHAENAIAAVIGAFLIAAPFALYGFGLVG